MDLESDHDHTEMQSNEYYDQSANTEQAPQPYILVIDDDPAIVALLLTLLRDEEGFRTRTVYSVRQALAQTGMTTAPPALILLDISLPGERLHEMVAQLRSLTGWSATPIILCSAQADLERLAQEVQASASLRKPFSLDAVVSLAEQYAQSARI